MRRTTWVFATVFLLAAAHVSARTPSFQGLGDLPGGDFYGHSHGVSYDGSAVVGISSSASGSQAFRWTATDGMVGLGDLPGGPFMSEAFGVSGDGTVAVGSGDTAGADEAFRWTEPTGMVGLGDLPGPLGDSRAHAASADGAVVVGYGRSTPGREAFRWTQQTGMVGLGDLPGGYFSSEARGVSADGSVVVGWSHSALGGQAFRWTEATGMVGLGDVPGGAFGSFAGAISPDGSTVVGWSMSASAPKGEASRWTRATGMAGLGDLPGGEFLSRALDTSADGAVVVGYGSLVGQAQRAFIWDADNGMRALEDVLVNDYGLNLSGWTLTRATGISADGSVIVGFGPSPNGRSESWRAVIPEPSFALLAGAGLPWLLRRRRYRTGGPERRGASAARPATPALPGVGALGLLRFRRRQVWVWVLAAAVLVPSGLAVAQPTDSAWPMFGHDQKSQRRSPFLGPQDSPRILWEFESRHTPPWPRDPLFYAAPSLGADGTIYAPSFDGFLYAVTPTGDLAWEVDVDYELRTSPAIDASGRIYLVGDGVRGFSRAGEELWHVYSGGGNRGGPTIGPDGTIYCTGGIGGHGLLALNPDGSEKWAFDVAPGASHPSLGDDGTVYFGVHGPLYAVDAEGRQKWSHPFPGGSFGGAAVADDGTLYAGDQIGVFEALRPDGTVKWSFEGGSNYYAASALGPEGQIYVAASNAIFAISPDGDELWRHPASSGAHSALLVDGAGDIYAARGNRILALEPDGDLKWELTLDYSIYSSLVLDDRGVLYAGANGRLYAIIPEPATLALLGMGALGLLRRRRARKRGLGGLPHAQGSRSGSRAHGVARC